MADKKLISIKDLYDMTHEHKKCDDDIDRYHHCAKDTIREIRRMKKESPEESLDSDLRWLKDYHDKMRYAIRKKNELTKKLNKIVKAANKKPAKKTSKVVK